MTVFTDVPHTKDMIVESSWDPEVYNKALMYAAAAHDKQVRMPSEPPPFPANYSGSDVICNFKIPYITHVVMVAAEVMARILHEPIKRPNFMVTVALLHDVLEDTDVTYDELAAEFNVDVANAVQALTKDVSLPRKERVKDSVSRIRAQPREVRMVKVADRIDNLRTVPYAWNHAKRMVYFEDSIHIQQNLGWCCEALNIKLCDRILECISHADIQYPETQTEDVPDGIPADVS